MGGREQRNTIADLRAVVGEAQVEDVRALDFLELSEGFLELQVRRVELSLVQVVIDGLARDRVAKGYFDMHECPGKALTSVIVELGSGAFVLEERKGDKRHLR